MISNNVYVALSVERCIALYLPLHAASLIRKLYAIIAVVTIVICSLLLCCITVAGASILLFDASGAGYDCTFVDSQQISPYTTVMVVFTWASPTLASVIMNIAIISRLNATMKSARTLHAQPANAAATKQNEASVTLLIMMTCHVLIYLPMAACRLTPIVAQLMFVNPNAVLSTVGEFMYPYLSITHVTNFCVYWNRVKGFKQNVLSLLECRRLKMSWKFLKCLSVYRYYLFREKAIYGIIIFKHILFVSKSNELPQLTVTVKL